MPSSSLVIRGTFGALGTALVGYTIFKHGNIVRIPEGKTGLIQNLRDETFEEDLLSPGLYFLPLLVYVIQNDTIPTPITKTFEIGSKDHQYITVQATVHNHFKQSEITKLARIYKLEAYKDKKSAQICKNEVQKVLGEARLVEWVEKKEELLEKAVLAIKEELEQSHMVCSDVEIIPNMREIKEIFSYFYSEEELKVQSFYAKLYEEDHPVLLNHE